MGAAIIYFATGPVGLIATLMVEVVSAEFAWIDSLKEVEKQLKIVDVLEEKNIYTVEQIAKWREQAAAGTLQYSEAVTKTTIPCKISPVYMKPRPGIRNPRMAARKGFLLLTAGFSFS